MGIPKGFPKSVGRVEAGIMAFHAFQPFEEAISDMFELIGRLQRGSMHEAAEKIEGIVRRIWNVHSS